jgi:hypothetical protein
MRTRTTERRSKGCGRQQTYCTADIGLEKVSISVTACSISSFLTMVYKAFTQLSTSSATDDMSWYDDAYAAVQPRHSSRENIPSRPGPITLRVTWKMSGTVWFERKMVDPTMRISRAIVDIWIPHGMRLYVAETEVQVFYDETPIQIFEDCGGVGVLSILHLDCFDSSTAAAKGSLVLPSASDVRPGDM